MELKKIVKQWLSKNGYDGLVSADLECGCEIDDLMPCDTPLVDCEAGYKRKGAHPDYPESDWVISTEK